MEWLDRPVLSIKEIEERLEQIIPKELDELKFINQIGTYRTLYVMLYCYAVDGEQFIIPHTVTCMTDKQAVKLDKKSREDWRELIQGSRCPNSIDGRWYAENSREGVRKKGIKELTRKGAIWVKDGIETNSKEPRYTLQKEFAELFNPSLCGKELNIAIQEWKKKNLSPAALARVAIAEQFNSESKETVKVKLPNGETKVLPIEKYTKLVKAIIEEFTERFLQNPVVIFITQPSERLDSRYSELCRGVGLDLESSRVTPDIILIDEVIDKKEEKQMFIIFIECVISDGPISNSRKDELLIIANKAGYESESCIFVTAFVDRAHTESRRLLHSIAWDSYVWFASEPENIIYFGSNLNDYRGKYLLDTNK